MGFLEILILVLMLGYNALVHWTISWLPVAYPYCNMWPDGTLELLLLSVHESVHLLMCGWGHGDVLGKSGLGSSKNLDSCLNTLSKKGRKMKGIDWLTTPFLLFWALSYQRFSNYERQTVPLFQNFICLYPSVHSQFTGSSSGFSYLP